MVKPIRGSLVIMGFAVFLGALCLGLSFSRLRGELAENPNSLAPGDRTSTVRARFLKALPASAAFTERSVKLLTRDSGGRSRAHDSIRPAYRRVRAASAGSLRAERALVLQRTLEAILAEGDPDGQRVLYCDALLFYPEQAEEISSELRGRGLSISGGCDFETEMQDAVSNRSL